MPASSLAAKPTWWGNVTLGQNQSCRLAIGGLTMIVTRKPLEWQIASVISAHESTDWKIDFPGEYFHQAESINRFVLRGDIDKLTLMPVTGDRAFVIEPQTAISLPPGQTALFYVSTIIWIKVSAGSAIKLMELPACRASDTWFGPDTMSGELCYASQTAGRLDINLLLNRPYRIITPIHLINDGKDNLLIERIKLPVPYLSVYASKDFRLWTEKVVITRTKALKFAELSIDKGCPDEAKEGALLAPPRMAAKEESFIHAISQLLG